MARKWSKKILFERIPIKLPMAVLVSALTPQHFFLGDNSLRISEFLSRVTVAFLCIFPFAYLIVAVALFLLGLVMRSNSTVLKWTVLSFVALGALVFFSDYIYFAYVSLRFDKFENSASYSISQQYESSITQYCVFRSKFFQCGSSKLCQGTHEEDAFPCRMRNNTRDSIKIFAPDPLSLVNQFQRGLSRLDVSK